MSQEAKTLYSGTFERSMDAKKRVAVPAPWLSKDEGEIFHVIPHPAERLSDGHAALGIRSMGTTNPGVAGDRCGKADGNSEVLQRGPRSSDRQARAHSFKRQALRPRASLPAKWCLSAAAAASKSGVGNATRPWMPAIPTPTSMSRTPSASDFTTNAHPNDMNKTF